MTTIYIVLDSWLACVYTSDFLLHTYDIKNGKKIYLIIGFNNYDFELISLFSLSFSSLQIFCVDAWMHIWHKKSMEKLTKTWGKKNRESLNRFTYASKFRIQHILVLRCTQFRLHYRVRIYVVRAHANAYMQIMG